MLPAKTAQYRTLLKHRSLAKTVQLHARIIISALLPSLRPNLAAAYALCGHVHNARKLFDELRKPTIILYNYMMRMYVNAGAYSDALKLFVGMLQNGDCRPDNFSYPFVFKACGELCLLELGRVVHGIAKVSEFSSVAFVENSLLAMYMSCGEKEAACKVFNTTRERNVISWNSMISGYFKNGCAKQALMVFEEMVDLGVEFDCASVVSVLPACGHLKELEAGRRIHNLVKEKGLGKAVVVRNALVDMYARCGRMDEAKLVFDEKFERDVVSWTSIINGHILNGDVRSGLALCREMQVEGIRPNASTISSLLSACAGSSNLEDGRCLHGWVIRQKLDSERTVETALINMYAKCRRMDISFGTFMKACRKRTVPWNAILSGCIHNSLGTEAIGLFKQMLKEGVKPNNATFSGFLPAYSILADLQPAKNIHSYLILTGFFSITEIATCLIDIYAKCGSLESAHKIFDMIPSGIKDIYVWSVIIASYGMHGHGETAVSLFRQMVKSGIKPNEVTFTSVLHACSHAGLVDEGLCLFKFMLNDLKTIPHDNHYSCIVDLLGRAGRLNEACDLIRSMPSVHSYAVWSALLSASVVHQNIELAEVAAWWLFELEPENTGNYVLLANLYAAAGRWKDAEHVRHMMSDIGLRKAPGHSMIEVKNT